VEYHPADVRTQRKSRGLARGTFPLLRARFEPAIAFSPRAIASVVQLERAGIALNRQIAKHQPSSQLRRAVEVLAGHGIPQRKIAQVIQITVPTLEKHNRAELNSGSAKVEAQLVGSLFRLAKGNDGTALKAVIFSLTTRFGWSA
jgi:hypothetical protein